MLAMPWGLMRFKALYDCDAIQNGFRSQNRRIIDEKVKIGNKIYRKRKINAKLVTKIYFSMLTFAL